MDAVALYWGVRRLLDHYTSSRRAVSSFHKMIADSWERKKAAGQVDTVEAQESGDLLFNGNLTTPAALDRLILMSQASAMTGLCGAEPLGVCEGVYCTPP